MISHTISKAIIKNLIKQAPSYKISFLNRKEEIKEIQILHSDYQQLSNQMKQNEQELIECLDQDPTNYEIKMKCAIATSLRRVLQNEIQDYLKNKQQMDQIKFSLLKYFSDKGFLLLENSRKPVMQLVKKYGSKQVEILFRANERHHVLKPDEQRHLYHHELDQTKDILDIKFENQYFNSLHEERQKIAKDLILDQENPLGNPLEEYSFTFLVVIKNKPDIEEYMVYECDEAYGEIIIQNIEEILKQRVIKEMKNDRKLNIHREYIPKFLNLSEVHLEFQLNIKLQQGFLDYLNSFDIDTEFVHNMHRASIFKQQNLFVEWLYNTHQIAVDLD